MVNLQRNIGLLSMYSVRFEAIQIEIEQNVHNCKTSVIW